MHFLDDEEQKRYAPERIQGSEREREREREREEDLGFLEKYDPATSNADAPPRIPSREKYSEFNLYRPQSPINEQEVAKKKKKELASQELYYKLEPSDFKIRMVGDMVQRTGSSIAPIIAAVDQTEAPPQRYYGDDQFNQQFYDTALKKVRTGKYLRNIPISDRRLQLLSQLLKDGYEYDNILDNIHESMSFNYDEIRHQLEEGRSGNRYLAPFHPRGYGGNERQEEIAKEANKPMGGEVEMFDMYKPKPKRIEGELIEGEEIEGKEEIAKEANKPMGGEVEMVDMYKPKDHILIGGRKTSGRKTSGRKTSGRKTRRCQKSGRKTRRCQKSGRKTRRGKNSLSLLKKRI